jgi:alpha,alpha-trehalase
MPFNTQKLLIAFLMSLLGTSSSDVYMNIERACAVYCEGDILHYVQISGIFNDSKTFVDMPMRVDPEEVTAAFADVTNPYDIVLLQSFLNQYFYEAGSDLDEWVPTDLKEYPSFIENIKNEDYQSWANSLNQLWLLLGRQVNVSATLYPQRTSFLPRQYPMIVPGGRFRESYYWDSWWIVRGLLVCEMPTTAEYVIRNLLDDLDHFNFVPNGGRIYYLDRSQPPLLSEMVVSVVEYYGWKSIAAKALLEAALPLLEREHDWWTNPANGHVLDITVQDVTYTLNRYHSNSTTPRPESYLADIETAGVELDSPSWEEISPSQEALYRNIRSGAETGWDFSSRWLSPTANPTDGSPVYNLSTIDTTHIVPVDLNAFMYRMELNLAAMVQAVRPEDTAAADAYLEAATNRAQAVQALLWNASSSR